MNKFRLFLPILVAVSLIGVPAYGAEAMDVEQPVAPQDMVAKSKQAVSIARKKAQAQFNESVDRFNRCIRGKCTKMEALKAARDLTIAAAAAIAAMYVTGVVIEKGGKPAAIREMGRKLQAPGKTIIGIPRARLLFPIGTTVYFRGPGGEGTVTGYSGGKVEVSYYMGREFTTKPFAPSELRYSKNRNRN